ncbi:hypothetical protein EIP91_000914 [Steccherinum ochraceum]|uniref:DUF6741 domain-containing protein n=1 Tax=Steccherinum ochraceum TaxID=92696 RepID=A0A4R0RHG7_9APHY|nr:hypothetical protein EIP91_000914 [Steccherinum ochraceum]
MAYPAYDSYNNQVGFPAFGRTISYHPQATDYAYSDGVVAGAYGENYPQSAHSLYSAGRQLSHYPAYDEAEGGYYPDRPVTPGYAPRLNHRRFSSMSHRTRPSLDSYRRYSSTMIKFRRKGGFRSGVTLGEAMANVRLSGNDSYSFHDLGVDHRGRMILRIRWSGYTSMTYEIPVDGYEGRVQLQTVARRIARAVVHFLQANMIPISWDRVILYHLEEHSAGVWQPVLSTS